MRKNFDFYFQPAMALGNIDIEDIGDCIIEGNPGFEKYYYLVIKTEYGRTKICKFGPVLRSLQYLVEEFKFEMTSFEYSEGRLVKQIDSFLNSHNIVQAREIDEEELEQNCDINLLKFMLKEEGEQSNE